MQLGSDVRGGAASSAAPAPPRAHPMRVVVALLLGVLVLLVASSDFRSDADAAYGEYAGVSQGGVPTPSPTAPGVSPEAGGRSSRGASEGAERAPGKWAPPYRPPPEYNVRQLDTPQGAVRRRGPCAALGLCKYGRWTGSPDDPEHDFWEWDAQRCCDARAGETGTGTGQGDGSGAAPTLVHFNSDSILKWFANRRVYVLGDSVARGVASLYNTLVMESAPLTREEAKGMCGSRSSLPSCSMGADTYTPCDYSWFQWFGRHAIFEDMGFIDWQEGDVCCQFVHKGGTVRDCLRELFHRADERDVLLIRGGIEYIGYGAELRYIRSVPQLPNWKRELEVGLRSLLDDLGAVFPGKMVWLLMAPVCRTKPMYEEWDGMTQEVNAIIEPMVRASGYFEGVIDPRVYNSERLITDKHYYENGLHPGPVIQNVTLQTFLNMVKEV